MSNETSDTYLVESLRRYCRSIELCDDFLRGYYGLKLVSNIRYPLLDKAYARQTSEKLLSTPFQSRQSKVEGAPDTKILQQLNETATAKLAEIVRRSVAREQGWEGYDASELIAARELLSRNPNPITR